MGGNVSSGGLRLRKKMFAGGNPDQDTSGDDPVDGLPKNDPTLMQGAGTGPGSYNWATNAPVAPTQQPAGPGFLQQASRVAGAVAPYLSNIYNAGRVPPMPSNPNLVAPVTLSKIRLDATRQQATSAARAQDLNADRSLDEQSAAAVRSSNLAKNLNQQGQISEQEAFLNARQKAEQAGMNLNVDAMNTSAINKTNDERIQRGIAIQREQSSNISNAADKFIGMRNEQAKAKLDMQKIQTLSQIWKQSGVYDRMMKKMKDSGDTDPTGIHAQMGWLGDIMDNDGPEKKAAGGALMNPLVGKKPVRPTLLSKPMTGAGKNSFKQVFAGGGPGSSGQFTPGTIAASASSGVGDANLADKLNYTIISGNMPKGGVDPSQQALFTGANIYHQTNPGMAPEAALNGYYSRPVDPNNPNDMIRGRLRNLNNGPVSNYHMTPDAALQMRQGAAAAPVVNGVASTGIPRAFGGYRSTMGKGYLNPFGNTRTIGLGPGIQKDKFNPYHVGHQQHNLLAMGGVPKTDGASDVNKDFTNYGDATPDLYEYGGIGGGYRMGGPFQEEYLKGGSISHPRVVDHSMWKEPYKENALTNNDPMLAMGGEFSGEATTKDMSMWNRKVWSKSFAAGGPTFNDDYFQGDQPVGLYAAAGGPLFNKDYFDDEPVQIFAANGGPVFNSDYFNDDPVQVYKNGGINIKPSHKGRFTAYKTRTGKTTSEALQSSDPHVRQMANFARNASKWKHGGRLKSVY